MEQAHRFTQFIPKPDEDKSDFERLFDIFKQLIGITGGDAAEAISWMNELDKQYSIILFMFVISLCMA